jgi:ADP-ribose pyrophosphatase
MTDDLPPWDILEAETVFQVPRRLQVIRETVRLPDGRVVPEYWRFVMGAFAVMVAETEDGRFIVLRQYRHGPRATVYSLPAGQLEAGEDPLTAARRELLEETGYEAAAWQALGVFNTAANAQCATGHAFRATGCRKVAEPDSGDLEDTQVLLLSRDDLTAALRANRFKVAGDLSALALALFA